MRLWLTAAIAVAIDLGTKELAFQRLSFLEPSWLCRGLLYLQLSLNRGALFGFLAGWGLVFVVASLAAMAFVLYLFRHTRPRQWGTHVILGLILGGALGNLYDRLFCIADIAAPDTGNELRGRNVAYDPAEDLYTIGSYPDGRELLGQAPGPLVRQPVVRDFIKIDARIAGRPLWRWVFNVADAWLVIGVVLLLLASWREHRRRAKGARRTSQPSG